MKFITRSVILILAISCILCGCTTNNILHNAIDSTDTEEYVTTAGSSTKNEEQSSIKEDESSAEDEEGLSSFENQDTTDGIGEKPIIDESQDPYENIDKELFYANYEPANSYIDAYFRTQNDLMSGSIDAQDQKPSISSDRPIYNDKYIKNTSANYSDGGYTYNIIDSQGNTVKSIYYGAAYITLEEVAAYVFAFDDVPANYVADTKTSPTQSAWGEYLRLNHSEFTGNTKKYPYEPVLPNISGCGGDFQYYEIDIGTTGTDCDTDKYPAAIYNDGYKITRGAARIVYARFDKNGDEIIDFNEKHVFYTYNHYNDFQEYLNYLGGWGKMFGNITGGGKLSDKKYCYPTPYVEVYCAIMDQITYQRVLYFYFDDKHTYDLCA